jgi:hypothetical protein
MTHRQTSIVTFGSTLAVAVLAAATMVGSARAEGPIGESTPFVGSRTRAEVRAELMQNRAQLTSYGSEWALQQGQPLSMASGYTRAQATAEYIAAREQVQAMNAEHGGSGAFAVAPHRARGTLFAREIAR